MKVLRCLGLQGALHIQAIQMETGMNYATTHRSIKRLEAINLVWLSQVNPRGPKGARTYSLTPYGVLELYLRGDLGRDIDTVIDNWDQATPRLIVNHNKIGFHSELMQLLHSTYIYLVRQLNLNEQIIWRDTHIPVERQLIDIIILDEILRARDFETSLEKMVEVIGQDQEYVETWILWYNGKKRRLDRLESINNMIHALNDS